MKVLLLAALVAVALALPVEVTENDLQEWENFKVKYERNYGTAEEEEKRKAVFFDRLKFIREHNAKYKRGESTFTVAINKFADMTKEEIFMKRKGLKRPPNYKRSGKEFVMPKNVKLNSTVDWRTVGAVTAVKSEGECGAGWAFSTTGSVESQHFLSTNTLVSLSEQNIIDCSFEEGNEGCNGGWPDWAFEYIISNGGIDTEDFYGYTGEVGSCKYKSKKSGATISNYVDIKSDSEKKLKAAVGTVGPVSASIDAAHNYFVLYKSGVYDESACESNVDDLVHAVLVVGYGTSNGSAYWLAKNCWGTDWGIDGYIMMSRNKNNQCGIATQASYPVV